MATAKQLDEALKTSSVWPEVNTPDGVGCVIGKYDLGYGVELDDHIKGFMLYQPEELSFTYNKDDLQLLIEKLEL